MAMDPGSGGKFENIGVALLVIAAVTALRIWFMDGYPNPLLVEEIYHWFLSSQPSWGYADTGPAVAAMLAFFGKSCAGGIECVRFLAPIAIGLTSVFCLIIAQQLCSRRTAVWAGILCVTLPFYTWLGAHLIPATFLVACFALLVVCEDDATQNQRFLSWIGYGIALGLGLYVHMGILFAVLATLLYLASYADTRPLILRGLLPALIVACLVASPHLLWLIEHGFITWKYMLNSISESGIAFNLGGAFAFLYQQLLSFGPILFIALFLCFIIRPAFGVKNRLLSLFLLPMFYTALLLAAFTDISPTWLAMIYVTALPQVVQALFRQGNEKLVMLSLLWALVVFFGFHVGKINTLQHRTDAKLYLPYYAPIYDKTHELLVKHNGYAVTDDRTMATVLSYMFQDPQTGAHYPVFKVDDAVPPTDAFMARYPFSAAEAEGRVALMLSRYNDLEDQSGQFETIKLLPKALNAERSDVFYFYQLVPVK